MATEEIEKHEPRHEKNSAGLEVRKCERKSKAMGRWKWGRKIPDEKSGMGSDEKSGSKQTIRREVWITRGRVTDEDLKVERRRGVVWPCEDRTASRSTQLLTSRSASPPLTILPLPIAAYRTPTPTPTPPPPTTTHARLTCIFCGSQTGIPKEMFPPYEQDKVPDVMPLPELALVRTTRGQEIAVPKLNTHQRSWIYDIGLRGEDLVSLKGSAATAFYDQVKTRAFESKAFQHKPQPEDQAEEDEISALVSAWKKNQKHESKKAQRAQPAQDDADDGEEEDHDGRAAFLRGDPKAGWRAAEQAIQKVIRNRRAAHKLKLKTSEPAQRESDGPQEQDVKESFREAPALAKLVGITAYSGRDKFRDDRHDQIHEYSKTLPGTVNAGGKFRKAEALLWTKEDQAFWDAAAAVDEDVDWAERQKLVATGFEQMVDNLHASRKFRPFVATMVMGWLNESGKVIFEWTEAVPDGIRVPETFRILNPQLVEQTLNAMYTWAEEPLKEYLATREESAKRALPVFPLSPVALDDLSHNAMVQTVTNYLKESFEAAFGEGEIPWAEIANEPERYYDATRFQLGFALAGLDLSRGQWCELGNRLAVGAGAGTLGFFRQAGGVDAPRPPPPAPSRPLTPLPRRSPARSPSPRRSPVRSPSPRRSPVRSPSPRRSPARSPSPRRSPVRSPSPRRSLARSPSPRRSPARSPSPRRSLARSPPPPPPPPAAPPRRLRGAPRNEGASGAKAVPAVAPVRETRATAAKRVAEESNDAQLKSAGGT
ncbi:hypothetical protein B0H11DRAFT_1935123 [Mycena galericulata]|nr:hypothetical protein B0H11DRAFT_1935123 [Mycena galericulata]